MNKRLLTLIICLISFSGIISAQRQNISGVIKNSETGITLPAVSVVVKNTSIGTYTDDRGRFKLAVSGKFPLTLIVSSTGYDAQELTVNNAGALPEISLNPRSTLGEEVVVNASRMTQRKLTSPVTIEQLSKRDIQQSPQLNYIDAL